MPVTTHKRSFLQAWLVLLYISFIAYASLSPFVGWRDIGITFDEVLQQDPWLTYTFFDAIANCITYMPLGFLLALIFRYYVHILPAVFLATLGCLCLSGSMEYTQMYLPTRVSSTMDLITNTSGGLLGAICAIPVARLEWVSHGLSALRKNLFQQGAVADAGLALLALWIFGQSNPSLPMLGSVFITQLSAAVPSQLPPDLLNGWELCAVVLNLLMIGCLLRNLLRNQHLLLSMLIVVLVVVSMIKFLTAALLLKSWALLLWMSSEAVLGMLIGLVILAIAMLLPKQSNVWFCTVVIVAYLLITNFVLLDSDPSDSKAIYHWHYKHLLNYNGLAKTLMLLFPILLLVYLWLSNKLYIYSKKEPS